MEKLIFLYSAIIFILTGCSHKQPNVLKFNDLKVFNGKHSNNNKPVSVYCEKKIREFRGFSVAITSCNYTPKNNNIYEGKYYVTNDSSAININTDKIIF